MSKIYGYARVSTAKQNLQRQIDNIKSYAPDVAKIFMEKYTGTKVIGREEFNKLKKVAKAGDTIVFDSVSRMSRNAQEGFAQYQEWLDMGVELVFLNEHYIDTATYKAAAAESLAMTDNEVINVILEGIYKALAILRRQQIEQAFEQAEKEAKDIKKRVTEGVAVARAEGKQIGRKQGDKLNSKIGQKIIDGIRKYSKDFGGMLNDTEVINQIGCSRGAYYKYKNMLIAEATDETA